MGKLGILLQSACILTAAAIIGNWFLAELRKSRLHGRPWYAAYLSIPGIIILAAILLVPIVIHLKSL